MVAGFAIAMVGGYLLASWKGGGMPWQSGSRPAVIVPGPGEAPPPVQTLPNMSGSFSSNPAVQGDILFEQGRFQEAISEYQKALATNPKDADTWNDLGLALHYTGRSQEALEALRKGTEANPRYQRVWLSLGFVSLQQNRVVEARNAWEQLIAIDATTPIADEARKFLKKIQ